ncbi:GNAT superfamily N-acetyltransferase [Xanthomonas sacchari]|nr:GNAT superfamily N-acetyltransferase [Xanthomonas sacchari]
MNLRVRQADAHDLPALAALFDAYRQFYGQAPDAATAHAFLAARLARAESVVLLAERAAQAAGFVQLYPSFSSVRAARLWILNDLYVAPAHRRHGVAQALLHAAERHAANGSAHRAGDGAGQSQRAGAVPRLRLAAGPERTALRQGAGAMSARRPRPVAAIAAA